MQITEGQSEYLDLYPTATVVHVHYVGAASGTLTPQKSTKEGDEIAIPLPNGDATITASIAFIVEGPGKLSFDSSSVVGVITVTIDKVE